MAPPVVSVALRSQEFLEVFRITILVIKHRENANLPEYKTQILILREEYKFGVKFIILLDVDIV
jgi:hypothetical protein